MCELSQIDCINSAIGYLRKDRAKVSGATERNENDHSFFETYILIHLYVVFTLKMSSALSAEILDHTENWKYMYGSCFWQLHDTVLECTVHVLEILSPSAEDSNKPNFFKKCPTKIFA
jgi:hypothetical protein